MAALSYSSHTEGSPYYYFIIWWDKVLEISVAILLYSVAARHVVSQTVHSLKSGDIVIAGRFPFDHKDRHIVEIETSLRLAGNVLQINVIALS